MFFLYPSDYVTCLTLKNIRLLFKVEYFPHTSSHSGLFYSGGKANPSWP